MGDRQVLNHVTDKTLRNRLYARPLAVMVVVLIVLGVFFRFAELGEKVYWVDEVATSIRLSGYTKAEVVQQLADGHTLSIEELQHYQHPNGDRSFGDTVHALIQSPEHAPLYFVLARAWVEGFGSSVVAVRSLSVLFSLLALPCLYKLALELYHSCYSSWVAVGLLSVSPFFVAYAQEARPYSLWSVTLLWSSVALLRGMRDNRMSSWGLYSFSLALSLYTSLLTVLVAVGQGIYVISISRGQGTLKRYVLASSVALLAFVPWLVVIVQHWHKLQDNTAWMRLPMDVLPMMAIWLYSLAVLFFDVPVCKSPILIGIVEVLVAAAVVGLMGFSLYFLFTHTPKRIWLFIFTLSLIPSFVLILTDLAFGHQLSTAPRYMLPCHLGILLAIAYLFANRTSPSITSNPQSWKWVALVLISVSLFSCVFQLMQPSKYQKSRSLHNQPIATILNQASSTQADSLILFAEPEQTLDLLSLSYLLKPNVKVQINSPTHLLPQLSPCKTLFLFNPSQTFQALLQQKNFALEQVYQPERLIPTELSLSLWSAKRTGNHCSTQARV